jgi:hypothetical protein
MHNWPPSGRPIFCRCFAAGLRMLRSVNNPAIPGHFPKAAGASGRGGSRSGPTPPCRSADIAESKQWTEAPGPLVKCCNRRSRFASPGELQSTTMRQDDLNKFPPLIRFGTPSSGQAKSPASKTGRAGLFAATQHPLSVQMQQPVPTAQDDDRPPNDRRYQKHGHDSSPLELSDKRPPKENGDEHLGEEHAKPRDGLRSLFLGGLAVGRRYGHMCAQDRAGRPKRAEPGSPLVASAHSVQMHQPAPRDTS